MHQAVTACNSGMTISDASKQYGIPRTTLSDRINHKVSHDAKIGRPAALTKEEEASLSGYVSYMYDRRFPIDREQVIRLAWAIDLKKEEADRAFGNKGPSMHWWRGFRDRHPELTLRKSETVGSGCVVTADVVQEYFNTLEDIQLKNNLSRRPHLMFNCDESAVQLNKSGKRVIIPRKYKRAHSVLNGTTQHVTALCCVSASGAVLPPLMVFAKGLPTGRHFLKTGPINAAYASSESGFVNQDIYLEWFNKIFLRYAPAERPLLLLQDGASAHLGVDLIDAAIKNDVILLCFPPKMTHLLQPCDVSLYRVLKSHIRACMQKVKMIRGELWVGKQNFPGIFNEVFLSTFQPGAIIDAFRACGIFPLNSDVIMEHVKKPESGQCCENSSHEKHTDTNQDSSNCDDGRGGSTELATGEFSIDVVMVTPSQIPADAEVILEASKEDPQPCPPQLALKAVEDALTPKKHKKYKELEATGKTDNKDPVYSTWLYLRQQVQGIKSDALPVDDHPLVKSGLIPRRLMDVFHVPPGKEPGLRRGARKARVLTSQEIADEFRENDKKRKATKENKKSKEKSGKRVGKENSKNNNRKLTRIKICKGQPRIDGISRTIYDTNAMSSDQRRRYFSHLQAVLTACKSYDALKQVIPRELPVNLNIDTSRKHDLNALFKDDVSETLLAARFPSLRLQSARVMADGNCLPRVCSLLCTGDEEDHVEMRVRIAQELILHESSYLNDAFLDQGTDTQKKWTAIYTQYSANFAVGSKLSPTDIKSVYQQETLDIVKPSTYCGMWQIHAMASVMGVPVRSLYPGAGSPKDDICRLVLPREPNMTANEVNILWTHTHNKNVSAWWQPNHFVAAFHTGQSQPSVVNKVSKMNHFPYLLSILSWHFCGHQ